MIGTFGRPVILGRSHTLAILALLIALTITTDPVAAHPETQLNDSELRVMLVEMGYDPRTVEKNVYEIKIERDGWPVYMLVSMSGSGQRIWFESKFAPVSDIDRVPANSLVALLEANERISPAHFTYRREDQRVHLYQAIENRDVVPVSLRKQIDSFDATVRATEPLWRSSNFVATTTKVVTPPKPMQKLERLEARTGIERQDLFGSWKVVGIEMRGRSLAPVDVEASQMTLTFSEDQLIIRRRDAADDVTAYSIDADSEPSKMNIVNRQGKVELAIFRMVGDTLTLSFADPGQKRPTAFETDESFAGGVLTMERMPAVFVD